MKEHGRSGPATRPTVSASTMCGGRCSIRSTCTRVLVTIFPTRPGLRSSPRWRLAEMRGDQRRAGQWAAAAREIHAEVCDRAVDARGVFTQHYGAGTLDASVLLLPLVHFLPPGDERIRRTVLAVADELTVDGLVLRYR